MRRAPKVTITTSGGEKGARAAYNAEYGAFSFSYDLRLGLKTSFSGKDLCAPATLATAACGMATAFP